MAEDKGKEEEKFDFTPEGEGYISLGEARVLAVRTAVESPGNYGRQYQHAAMAFEVVESGEEDDHYAVTLSFRPQGSFDGTPGQEQFVIGKDGTIAVRQVLSSIVRKGGGFPVIPVAIGLVVVGIVAAVGAVFVLMGSGGDGVPIAVVVPTETPAPTQPPAPVVIPADAPEPTVNIDATVEAGIQQGLVSRATAAPPMPTPTETPAPVVIPADAPEPTVNIAATVEAGIQQGLASLTEEARVREAVKHLYELMNEERWQEVWNSYTEEFRSRCSFDAMVEFFKQSKGEKFLVSEINETEILGETAVVKYKVAYLDPPSLRGTDYYYETTLIKQGDDWFWEEVCFP